jgi:hypothetical protein
MPDDVSRRGALALGVAALAGCLSNPRDRRETAAPDGESTPRGTSVESTTEPGCPELVGPAWGTRDEEPVVPACPSKPETLDACSARAFALGLEKHVRYRRAIRRHERLPVITFDVYTAAVTAVESGYVVSARIYFTASDGTGTTVTTVGSTATTPAPDTTAREGTVTAEPIGIYDVDYLVTADGQWRAVDEETAFDTASGLRMAGSAIECSDDA